MAGGDTESGPPLEAPGASGAGAQLLPVVVRKAVVQRANYRDYRQDLREDFLFSCAYCTITETEAQGVGFNIDHYLPQEHHAHLAFRYSNLMWSCQCCNETKADYPGSAQVPAADHTVIKVDEENPRAHLKLERDADTLDHKTFKGEFNIQCLRLNRPMLRKLRATRRKLYDSSAYIAYGVSELLDVSLDALESRHRPLLHRLQRQIEGDHQRVVTSIQDLIEAAARSELLDAERDRRKELAARREFLCSIGAIGPGLTTLAKSRERGRKGHGARRSKGRRR